MRSEGSSFLLAGILVQMIAERSNQWQRAKGCDRIGVVGTSVHIDRVRVKVDGQVYEQAERRIA